MKPITINITNLIDTLVIVGDKESASTQIQENVNDALLKVFKTVTESIAKENSIKDYSKAKILLGDLIETAFRAMNAIDNNKPHWEISNIDEEIEELSKQITSAILGDRTSIVNSNSDVVK